MLKDCLDLGAIWKFLTGKVLPVCDSTRVCGKFKFCCYVFTLLSSSVLFTFPSAGLPVWVKLSYISKEVLTLRLLFFAPLLCTGSARDYAVAAWLAPFPRF